MRRDNHQVSFTEQIIIFINICAYDAFSFNFAEHPEVKSYLGSGNTGCTRTNGINIFSFFKLTNKILIQTEVLTYHLVNNIRTLVNLLKHKMIIAFLIHLTAF